MTDRQTILDQSHDFGPEAQAILSGWDANPETRPFADPTQREALRDALLAYQAVGNPIVSAYGGGVDSTAYLMGLQELGVRPDLILMADTGDERKETYDFVNGPMQAWLKKVGFPPVTWVKYIPKDFKHWPAYGTLSENCLTNSTLPSLAFGFKSCSLKWKVGPQDKYVAAWEPAQRAWAAGGKVIKLIGYDAGPKDIRRRNHAGDRNDAYYTYLYLLIEWLWDRDKCKAYIVSRGLPCPCKSACYMCPATRPEELHDFPVELLQRIVILETRAHDRLMGNWSEEQMLEFNKERWKVWKGANTFRPAFEVWMELLKPLKQRNLVWDNFIPAPGYENDPEWSPKFPKPMATKDGVTGLWRASTKTRSGKITDYIRAQKLLPEAEIDRLIRDVPRQALTAEELTNWEDWISGFIGESSCEGCSCVGV